MGPLRSRRQVRVIIASKPIFVVGCGHSGTTLMASLISRHSAVLGIGDETGAFRPDCQSAYSVGAIDQWDTFTRQFAKTHFVEKTPKHVHDIRRIFATLPSSRIIFVTRNPLDTVASLYERVGDLDSAIERYASDTSAGLKWARDKRVLQVRYEDLIARTEPTLEEVQSHCRLTQEFGLHQRPDRLYRHWNRTGDNREKRADQVSQPIRDTSGSWRSRLTEEQAFWVADSVEPFAYRLGYERWLAVRPPIAGD